MELNLTAIPADSAAASRFSCSLDGASGSIDAVAKGSATITGALARVADHSASLLAEERTTLAPMVAKRVREFTSGRLLARTLLAEQGYPNIAVPVGEQRMPVWPANITGSISHTRQLAAAVLCNTSTLASVGLDIEIPTAVSVKIARKILTPGEQANSSSDPAKAQHQLALRFCAKEAIFKAVYPIAHCMFDFLDVDVTVKGNTFSARASASCKAHTRGLIERLIENGNGTWSTLAPAPTAEPGTGVAEHLISLFALPAGNK